MPTDKAPTSHHDDRYASLPLFPDRWHMGAESLLANAQEEETLIREREYQERIHPFDIPPEWYEAPSDRTTLWNILRDVRRVA